MLLMQIPQRIRRQDKVDMPSSILTLWVCVVINVRTLISSGGTVHAQNLT